MLTTLQYDFIVSSFCLVFDIGATVALGYALTKSRALVTWLFLIAVSVSIITSMCNVLNASMRLFDLVAKYKPIFLMNYKIVVVTEPVALFALYAGLIAYAVGVAQREKL